MSIFAEDNGGKSIEPIKSGTYIARCVQMIHIGTITEEIQGKSTTRNLVRFTFELPTEQHVFDAEKGSEPRFVSKEFSLSLNEKATLRKFLDTWRGVPFTNEEAKRFDVTRLIGVPCMLSVGLKTSGAGRTYNSLDGALAIPNGIPCPDQITPSLEINFENISENWDKIPGFIQEKIKTSVEYAKCGFVAPEKTTNEQTQPEQQQTTPQPTEQPQTGGLPFGGGSQPKTMF
jgi:hypothetical protein